MKTEIIKLRKYNEGLKYEDALKLCKENDCEMIDANTYLDIPLGDRSHDDYLPCNIFTPNWKKGSPVRRGYYYLIGNDGRSLGVGGRSGYRRGVLGVRKVEK